MKNLTTEAVEKLLQDPRVMICVAKGVEYEIEYVNDEEGHPTKIVFKTKNRIKFIKDGDGNILGVMELQNEL